MQDVVEDFCFQVINMTNLWLEFGICDWFTTGELYQFVNVSVMVLYKKLQVCDGGDDPVA